MHPALDGGYTQIECRRDVQKRHAVHVVQHDHGAIHGPQLVNRGGQYRAELGLSRWVIAARRLKVRRKVVPRYFALSAVAAPQQAVGCVDGDAIDPCPERRVTLERLDFPHHGPQRVLYDLFRVRLAAGDAHREPMRSSAVGVDERLRCVDVGRAQAPRQLPVRELQTTTTQHSRALVRRCPQLTAHGAIHRGTRSA